MAERVRIDGFVYRTDGVGAALDTVQEIADVVGAPGELDFEGIFVLVDEVFGLEVDTAAIDVDPAVGAFEGGAMTGDAAVTALPFFFLRPGITGGLALVAAIGNTFEFHRDAAAEFEVDIPDGGRVAHAFRMEAPPSFDFDGAVQQITTAPNRDVHGMDAPARDETQGVVGGKPPSLLSTVG